MPLSPGTPREVHPNVSRVTGAAAVVDGSLRLLSVATDQRPRDIRLILE